MRYDEVSTHRQVLFASPSPPFAKPIAFRNETTSRRGVKMLGYIQDLMEVNVNRMWARMKRLSEASPHVQEWLEGWFSCQRRRVTKLFLPE